MAVAHPAKSNAKSTQYYLVGRGQNLAEYAVMLAVILVLVVGTIRLVGTDANNVFLQSRVRSSSPHWFANLLLEMPGLDMRQD